MVINNQYNLKSFIPERLCCDTRAEFPLAMGLCLQIFGPDYMVTHWPTPGSLHHSTAHQWSDHCNVECTRDAPLWHWPQGVGEEEKCFWINCLVCGSIITGRVRASCWDNSDKEASLQSSKHQHSANYQLRDLVLLLVKCSHNQVFIWEKS